MALVQSIARTDRPPPTGLSDLPGPADLLAPLPIQWATGGFLDRPRAELVRMLEVWRVAAGTAAFPTRQAFGPGQLRPVLPHVHVYAVDQAPLRFTIRLVGTHMTEHIGRNLAGKPVADVPLENLRRAMTAILSAVVSSRGAIHIRAVKAVALPNGDHHSLESLWLPCAEDGAAIDRVVAITLLGGPE